MSERQTVVESLEFRTPPYVPWAWDMTLGCRRRLSQHLKTKELEDFVGSHFFDVGARIGASVKIDEGHVRDYYGVVWDRTVDKDIGTPFDWPIKRPEDLRDYQWPDPAKPDWYVGIPEQLIAHGNLFRRYCIGFSLYERAWTMRGMTNLLIDMVERPEFVEQLLDLIVEHNLVHIHKALTFDIDMIHFGDDYGMQKGLIFGINYWRHFIKPRLAKMFAPIKEAGIYVSLHSCGCVTELFDDLIEIGLDMFNPFQPEVMDVFELQQRYHGRLAFHGGMSIQKTLPFGTEDEVGQAAQKLIESGKQGGYVFSPSHSVPSDVPPENLIVMMRVLRSQPGFAEAVSCS